MSHLPVLPMTMPRDLQSQTNGALPSGLLRSVGPQGQLHHLAARSFEALRAAARVHGWHLTYTYGGTFRSYESQKALFLRRYSTEETSRHSKVWKGVRYWNHTGAMAAVPGTSNHGWGLAIDLALDFDLSDGVGPDDAKFIAPAIGWLTANAWRYGFSWEVQSEPWHIRYVTGDAIPAATLDFERGGTPARPTPPLLRRGARGPWVAYLQRVLKLCNPSVIVDGDFGPKTEWHVVGFQKTMDLTIDGFVGPQTWAKVMDLGDGFQVARP